jgi:hypothetical protein
MVLPILYNHHIFVLLNRLDRSDDHAKKLIAFGFDFDYLREHWVCYTWHRILSPAKLLGSYTRIYLDEDFVAQNRMAEMMAWIRSLEKKYIHLAVENPSPTIRKFILNLLTSNSAALRGCTLFWKSPDFFQVAEMAQWASEISRVTHLHEFHMRGPLSNEALSLLVVALAKNRSIVWVSLHVDPLNPKQLEKVLSGLQTNPIIANLHVNQIDTPAVIEFNSPKAQAKRCVGM